MGQCCTTTQKEHEPVNIESNPQETQALNKIDKNDKKSDNIIKADESDDDHDDDNDNTQYTEKKKKTNHGQTMSMDDRLGQILQNKSNISIKCIIYIFVFCYDA